MNHTLPIPTPRQAGRAFFLIIASLASLSLVGQIAKHGYGHTRLKGFVPAFYLDYESNVPTWYSSSALALAAALLCLIATVRCWQQQPGYRRWFLLSGGFLFLSIDEVAMFHEYPIAGLRESLNAGGLLYYTWVLPALAMVPVCALAMAGLLKELPRRTRNEFLLAAGIFLGGCIGVEMLSGLIADQLGEENLSYALVITAEEILEMTGIAVFICSLLGVLREHVGQVTLQLRPPQRQASC